MQLKGDKTLPLSDDEFHELMVAINSGQPQSIAVAVSGGGDSMALALLLNQWCQKNNIQLFAVTIDHGLRDASKAESKSVADWLKRYNINHEIIEWVGKKPSSNIQGAARNARYSLIEKWCAARKIAHLFVAHHKDDQAETFLMRLLRGSGVDGLSAMQPVSKLPVKARGNMEVNIFRPLLSIGKERLIKTLEDIGQSWVSDPSNENDNFTRIKVRKLLETSDIDGLDRDKLTATALKMSRVKSLLDELTDRAESDYVQYDPLGCAQLSQKFDETLHEEIALRLLSRLLKKISGGAYPTRYQKLLTLYENIKEKDFSGQTLSGVTIFSIEEGYITFVREAASISEEKIITVKKQILWDNRFTIHSEQNFGKVTAFTKELMMHFLNENPTLKQAIYEKFHNSILRDKILPTLPIIITNDEGLVLPSLLFPDNNEKIYDTFLVNLEL